MRTVFKSLKLQHGASLGAITIALLLPTLASAQAAPPSPQDTAAPIAPVTTTSADAQADETGQDIIVTGFRQSLQAALDLKRNSVASVDAIVAEDIGKFPDQNLAESLQRIPGVAITRDGGEGREISVRGLGSQFTVTRVNGLPAQAASMLAGSGGSNNRDRSFDFNIFASELFRSLVVHKTAEPSIDEGSLGGVIDLNTGHPLGAKSGLTGLASAAASYNDLSKKAGPRLAGLLNWKSEDGTFGINGSLAYSHTKTDELGNNTTRWAQAAFASVTTGGVTTPCFAGATYVHSAACDKATLAFHPRIPRYGIITHDRERLGATGAIEWQPSDRTHLELDGLYSRYHEVRDEKWLEVLLRSNEKGIALVNPTYDGNNNLITGTFNNAYDRQEHYTQTQIDTFYQFSGTLTQNIGSAFKVNLLGGLSRSVENVPIATTLMLDNKTAQGFSYDYTNMASPVLTYGTSVTDPTKYQLAEIRDAPTRTVNTFKSGELNTEWTVNPEFTVKAGGVYRKFGFDTSGGNRNTLVCPANGKPDAVLGTFTCTTAQYGFPVTSSLVDTVSLGNAGQPAGTTSTFIVADLPAGTAFTNLYGRPLVPDTSNTRSVSEEDKGAYLQFDAQSAIFGLKFALNGGVRYVETDQSSTGLQNGTTVVTVGRTYEDWLPSVNLAFYPTSKINLRFAIAKVMTRPGLGNLTPGGSVDSFNFKVSYGNPQLDPYRATNFDAAFEWYFTRQSLLSVAFFHKDIASFPLASSIQGTYASTGLPLSILSPGSPAAQNPEAQPWTISTVVNGTGAKLSGIELGLQTPFRFLPGPLKNLGIILNATFIGSNATYTVQAPGTTITSTGAVNLVNTSVSSTFFGLSKRTWNATLYYEKGGFSARGSFSYRGPYNDQNSATGNIFEGFSAYTSLDSAIRYSITRNVDLSLDGTNLLDRYTYHWTDAGAQRNYESYHVGRTIVAGARFKF
jgi:iron complex outermembrane receptor protein